MFHVHFLILPSGYLYENVGDTNNTLFHRWGIWEVKSLARIPRISWQMRMHIKCDPGTRAKQQVVYLHSVGHCKHIRGCDASLSFLWEFLLEVPVEVLWPLLSFLFHLASSAFPAEVLSYKKPGEESELHCSFLGFSSSVFLCGLFLHLFSFLFLWYWRLWALYFPPFPQGILSSNFIHV